MHSRRQSGKRNEELLEQTDIISYDPYGRDWIAKIKLINPRGVSMLLKESGAVDKLWCYR